jgi:arylsulfatase A-like enzyme
MRLSRRAPVVVAATAVMAFALVGTSHGVASRGVASHGVDHGIRQRSGPPNIVLILTDDMRFDELPFMPTVESELVGKSVNFVNGFDVNPLCCPSRTTILTGKYSHGTDIYDNQPPHGGFETFEPQEGSTIATWLHDAGYSTGIVGKYLNGYSPQEIPHVAPGWDEWDVQALPGHGDGQGGYYKYAMSINGTEVDYGSDEQDYSTDVFSSYATAFIHDAPASNPLFLYFATRAPHTPVTPPPRYKHACPDVQPLRPPSYNEADVSDKPAWVQALRILPPKAMQRIDKTHLDHCRTLLAVDDAVSSILGALADTGRLDDTLIVFASDNGLQLGEHRWYGKKAGYEESIRVPIVVRFDPITGGASRVDKHLVLNLDFAPTFADAGGVGAPGAEGVSLLPLVDQSASSWRTNFLVEHWEQPADEHYIPAFCEVRNLHYAYVDYADGEEELYDLRADPNELTNVASSESYATIKAHLHKLMLRLCDPPPPGFAP